MLSGAARRLISLYGIRPGTRAVVATVDDRGLEAAVELQAAGVELAAVADLRREAPPASRPALARAGIEIRRATTVLEARGRSQVSSRARTGRRRARGGEASRCATCS